MYKNDKIFEDFCNKIIYMKTYAQNQRKMIDSP